MEIELEEIKRDRDEFKKLFLEQLGLSASRAVMSDEDRQVIHKPMSPLRMRQSLEASSRKAVSQKPIDK
jgi:hypothetical protein